MLPCLKKKNSGYKIICAVWSQILKSKEVQKRSGIEEPRHLCRKKVQEGVENKMLGLESVCGAARPFDPLLRNSTQPCHFHYTPLLPSLKVWSSLRGRLLFLQIYFQTIKHYSLSTHPLRSRPSTYTTFFKTSPVEFILMPICNSIT